jgi:hypothetical protein
MAHALWRHRGNVNYNGPKVARAAFPRGNTRGNTRLYAGKPLEPTLLGAQGPSNNGWDWVTRRKPKRESSETIRRASGWP